MKAVVCAGFFLLSIFIELDAFVLTSNRCPSAELIHPCTCVYNVLTCRGLTDQTTLAKVIKNSAGHKYDEVQVINATLQYISKDLFNQTLVKRLTVQNSKLISLFNYPPNPYASLEAIYIIKSTILRRNWELLKPFTGLQFLKIYDSNNINFLSSGFGDSLPKSINTIMISGTNLQRIKPGAFNGLVNLKKLTINSANLHNLSRDAFPTPFNVKVLEFTKNNWTSVPKNLFTQMPELRVINLNQNNISSLPEAEFGGKHSQLVVFANGNPLKCDCNLLWVVNNGSTVVDGICSSPESLKGQRIMDLWKGEFEC